MPQRQSSSLASILVICLIVALVLYRSFHRSILPNPQITCGEHCGTERWQIKTASDPESRIINWTPRSSTISDLAALQPPSILDDSRSDAEKHVYSVEAVLLGWKAETGKTGDPDFHLVLGDPKNPGQ